jgi:hypothetical protein
VGELSHGLGRAAQVHQHVGHAQAAHGGEHVGVEGAARHVVHQVGPGRDGRGGHRGPKGVGGEESLRKLAPQQRNGGQQPLGFLGSGMSSAPGRVL